MISMFVRRNIRSLANVNGMYQYSSANMERISSIKNFIFRQVSQIFYFIGMNKMIINSRTNDK